MPSVRIPLVGSYNQRFANKLLTTDTGDQRFVGCVFQAISNPVTQSATVYCIKRGGMSERAVIDSGAGAGNAIFRASSGTERLVTAFGATDSTIYISSYAGASVTNCGTITGLANFVSDVILGGVVIYLITSTDNTGWFLPVDAITQTSYTGDTHSNTTVDGIASTAGMYAGQAISGSGIPASTRIQSVDSSTAITITQAATATASGVTLTKTPVAKIIDSDFPSNAGETISGGFAEMDGYVFIMTVSGDVYNCDLNNITAWSATSKINAGSATDRGAGVARYKNFIVAFGVKSIEFLYNAGNAAGSPLSRAQEAFTNVGCFPSSSSVSYFPLRDTIYWIGRGVGNSVGVYKFDGGVPKKISVPSIENILFENTFFISAFEMNGYPHVYIQYYGNRTGFLYNDTVGLWSETWFNNGNVSQQYFIYGHHNGVAAVNDGITGGKLFYLDNSVFTDNGSAFTMTIQMARQDFGTGNRKFLKSIELVADQQSSGTTALEISTDDFATFTTLGTFDMTKAKKIIHRCGSFKGGASLRLTHSANTAWRGEALIVNYDVGVH